MAARRERAVTPVLGYEELRIRVRRVGGPRYLVTAGGPACAAEVMAVDGEPEAFREQWDRLIAAELGYAPMGEQHTVAQLRALGRGVFRLLFGDPAPVEEGERADVSGEDAVGGRVGACVDTALDRAQGMRPARGLRLRFDLPPELRDLPLESLCAPPGSPQQSLALNHGYSLVRSLAGGPLGQRLPEPADEPSVIRLLVVCASPRGLQPLRTAAEVAAIRNDLPEVAVHTAVVEHATRASVEYALGVHSELPMAVLVIAHGAYDREIGKGVVALETENGDIDRVPADLLAAILLKAQRLRFVALNLCAGADSSHLEPFSGIAQALIGGGVPAVVAMRGRVSDVSAGAFGPELLKGIAANRTVDEAVAAARLRISHQPEHTAVEWATPALFLHEGCRQGWLFKAREVRDDEFGAGGEAVADPLREGEDALRTFQSFVGHVGSAALIGAARFQRDLGNWAQVQRILRTPTQSYADERRRMRAEAAFELAWPGLEKLCALLAGERDAAGAEAQLDVVRELLPGPLPGALVAEVAGLRGLVSLVDEARAAEAGADWATAIDRYEEVLAVRPGGLRDVTERLAAARDELHVARVCEAAERAREAGDWTAAADGYAAVLALRPGHGTALARSSYVAGRAAEAREDWPAAEAAYAVCADLDDAAGRAAYARGRAAAEDGAWAVARDAFAQAGPDCRAWQVYCSGRAADAAGDWDTAAEAYAAANGFLDSAVRLLFARGRGAADAGRTVEALTALSAAAARGWDTEPWLGDLRREVYEAALAATAAGDWPTVLTHLSPLPPDFHATHALRRYAEGRLAAAAGEWASAAEAFGECEGGGSGGVGGGLAGSAGGVPADSGDLCAYAQGRLCEARGLWDDALAVFVGLPAGLGDVSERVLYARGRAADVRGEWDGVIDGFGRLPDGYADGEVGVRRLYARARVAADSRGDWAAVLSLLTGVPDAAREGAVAALRRKAEGRRAEENGDWAAACAVYGRAFPDGTPPPEKATGPDPDAAPLYHYALARTHEQHERWQEAADVYRLLGSGTDAWADVDVRLRYVRARVDEGAAEGGEDWRRVVEAYEGLEDVPGLDDVAVRGRYARVRAAEAEGDWACAAAEADALGAHRDAPAVAAYARGRLADAHQEWQRAADAFRQCGGHRDADAHLAYAEGRLLEASGRWSAAVAAYERAGSALDRADVRPATPHEKSGGALDPADVPPATPHTKAPGALDPADNHPATPHEKAGGPLDRADVQPATPHEKACGALDPADVQPTTPHEKPGGVLDRADVRCRRLRRLIGLLPWADGLTGAPLVADPFAVRDQAFPYLALRDAGVDPGASMDVVKNASYALLERGTMSWHERVALERLRLPGRRLQLDALLYRWYSPDALRDALSALSPDEGPGLLDALCARSPQDAPLLLLLARDREAAAAEWERRLKEAPGDMAVVHGLAVARLWQAQELEQSGAWEHAVHAWESALAYWATLLSDDEYWDGWRAERATAYERDLTHDDMASLRWELSQHLFAQLSAYEQRHTEQDRPQQAAAYQALAALLESELGGARVLKDVGGLPSVPGSGATLACGPRYLRLLCLQEPLAELAATLDAAAQQGKDPGEYPVRELRWAFSELARSFTLSEVRKFEAALRALPVLPTLTTLPDDCTGPAEQAAHTRECGHCQDFLRRNPAYVRLPRRHARLLQDGAELAVHVRLALARTALTRGDGGLDEALAHWGELVKVSRNAGMQARSKKAVIRTVLGRVEALTDEEGVQLGGCLDEAVTLVESVIAALHPLDRELLSQLNAKLSALLSMRGVWRGYTRTKHGMRSDMHGAETDLRRALALNPESSHARDNLARAFVFTLDERTYDVPARLKLLHDALGLLDVGLGQALTHRYRETLAEALDEMEKLLTRHLGVEGMGALIRSDGREPPPDEGDLASWAAELTLRAERALRDGDILWALHHLIRATRAEPTDSRIRQALLGAVNHWLAELTPGAEPRENELDEENRAGGSVA
ncbi:CHAT domain-containing protein [Streptomyces sp. Je 1-369]|uniref:CHAT domain-containing protein n=1 Tax=Streptomyces sp. Je 1-369 TaxID=2966192 RepID=UPI0022861343|nr:CHAT domain-containing protein [Streptomyces sp. Je 1-369]WAL98544.1 CHAT domain-containing protein [Streptomyces sp. Je 1-369]